MAAAFGKTATCVIGAGLEADCTVEGKRLADQLHRPAVLGASMDWR
jgi:hypothetical protein